MQVELDVNCMETNFGGCVLFVFGDIATFNAIILALTDFTEGVVWPSKHYPFLWHQSSMFDINFLFTYSF